MARAERQRLEVTTQRLQQAGLRIQRLSQLFSDSERDLLSEYVTRKDLLTRRIVLSNLEIDRLLEELSRVAPAENALLEDLRKMRRAAGRGAALAARGATHRRSGRSAFVRWWFLDQRATALLADISAANLKGLDRILAQVGESRRRSDILLLTLTFLCALTVTGMTLYVVRGVVRPLVRLTAASQKVGKGRVIRRLEGRRDELGTLSRGPGRDDAAADDHQRPAARGARDARPLPLHRRPRAADAVDLALPAARPAAAANRARGRPRGAADQRPGAGAPVAAAGPAGGRAPRRDADPGAGSSSFTGSWSGWSRWSARSAPAALRCSMRDRTR